MLQGVLHLVGEHGALLEEVLLGVEGDVGEEDLVARRVVEAGNLLLEHVLRRRDVRALVGRGHEVEAEEERAVGGERPLRLRRVLVREQLLRERRPVEPHD